MKPVLQAETRAKIQVCQLPSPLFPFPANVLDFTVSQKRVSLPSTTLSRAPQQQVSHRSFFPTLTSLLPATPPQPLPFTLSPIVGELHSPPATLAPRKHIPSTPPPSSGLPNTTSGISQTLYPKRPSLSATPGATPRSPRSFPQAPPESICSVGLSEPWTRTRHLHAGPLMFALLAPLHCTFLAYLRMFLVAAFHLLQMCILCASFYQLLLWRAVHHMSGVAIALAACRIMQLQNACHA